LSGTYDLTTVNAQALPFRTWVNESSDTLYLTGGEIRFQSRGRLSVVQRRRWHTVGGAQPEDSDTLVLTYHVNGSEILIDYPTYTDTGQFADDWLSMKAYVNLGQGAKFHHTLLYQRR
jgi:hypothetical protein